jgi:Flp pilus assembly protein TadG
MRLTSGRPKHKRSRERGAAAVEFALVLPFIVILMLGMLDYGYYFYVGVNATEAARAAAMQAVQTAQAQHSGAGIANCADASVANVVGPPNPSAPAAAATAYMTTNMNATIAGYTTTTVTCDAKPTNPSWKVYVQVDFPPASGFMHPGLPASAITGRVRYKTPFIIRSR